MRDTLPDKGWIPRRRRDAVSGELPCGEVESIVGTGERQARRITAALTGLGVLTADSAQAPLQIVFPATLAGSWMPAPLAPAEAT